eukprot:tig00021532_g22195.t1
MPVPPLPTLGEDAAYTDPVELQIIGRIQELTQRLQNVQRQLHSTGLRTATPPSGSPRLTPREISAAANDREPFAFELASGGASPRPVDVAAYGPVGGAEPRAFRPHSQPVVFAGAAAGAGAQDLTSLLNNRRLLVVANRAPVTMAKNKETGEWGYKNSSGGLVSGLAGMHGHDYVWVGWPGLEVAAEERGGVTKTLFEKHRCHPVYLADKLADSFYNGFCNEILWPLFHYVPLQTFTRTDVEEEKKFSSRLWDAYVRANEEFCEAVMQIYDPERDIVWVHDYHLMMLPAMLRKRHPEMRIGFFLHIPFPAADVYRVLPWRAEVLEGVVQSDLVGFHTFEYARHFLSSCDRVLGLQPSPTWVQTASGHLASVGIFPIGTPLCIDYLQFLNAQQKPSVQARIAQLLRTFQGRKVILGVDRLDYIKGLPHKLRAFEALLERHPRFRGRVVLMQIAIPSRTSVDDYRQLTAEARLSFVPSLKFLGSAFEEEETRRSAPAAQVNELVGRISSRFGTLDYSPIQYLYQSVNFDELTALYTMADVLLATSLRDGMNLVVQEYIACQQERHGVVVVSEFAGSAGNLSTALRINPWNTEETAGAVARALDMHPSERAARHTHAFRHISKHTSSYWGTSFVCELLQVADMAEEKAMQTAPLSARAVREAYRRSSRRLICLDYDGTLVGFCARPADALPSPALLEALGRLCGDGRNAVYVVSGRDRSFLESTIGHLPVGIFAEHGCYFRPPPPPAGPGAPGEGRGDREAWEDCRARNLADGTWKEQVRQVMQDHGALVPGSFVEEKESAIVWHYRSAADPAFAAWTARELLHTLNAMNRNQHFDTIPGAKILEARASGADKGSALERLLVDGARAQAEEAAAEGRAQYDSGGEALPEIGYDFVLCVGDDRTDEDMFEAASHWLEQAGAANPKAPLRVYSVCVGKKASAARYYLPGQPAVVPFLASLPDPGPGPGPGAGRGPASPASADSPFELAGSGSGAGSVEGEREAEGEAEGEGEGAPAVLRGRPPRRSASPAMQVARMTRSWSTPEGLLLRRAAHVQASPGLGPHAPPRAPSAPAPAPGAKPAPSTFLQPPPHRGPGHVAGALRKTLSLAEGLAIGAGAGAGAAGPSDGLRRALDAIFED